MTSSLFCFPDRENCPATNRVKLAFDLRNIGG